MKTALSLVSLLVLLACHASADIPPEEAAKHVGEKVTVEGVVAGTHTTYKGTVFLDFGAKYPREVFTAYLPATSAAAWAEADLNSLLALSGKTVSVTGTVKLYKGKPEIVVSERRQVSP